MCRPRASTSGGQSEGGAARATAVLDVLVGVEGAGCCLASAIQEATDEQLRHLWQRKVSRHCSYVRVTEVREAYGLPSLPNTTPLGSVLGPPAVVAASSLSLLTFLSDVSGATAACAGAEVSLRDSFWSCERYLSMPVGDSRRAELEDAARTHVIQLLVEPLFYSQGDRIEDE